MMKFFYSSTSKHIVKLDQVRLDRFVAQILGRSWGSSQKIIREGFVRQDGQKIKDYNHKLMQGDEIEIKCIEPIETNEVTPVNVNTRYSQELISQENSYHTFKSILLYEDDNFMVINKPYGFCSQGGADPNRNLPHLAANYLIQSGQDDRVMRIMHRIDQPVSGLIFMAKQTLAAQQFNKMLETRTNIKKLYMCVTDGIPKELSGIIQAPLSFNKSKQKAQVTNYTNEDHKASTSYYSVVQQSGPYSLMRVQLIDGRKHQIRAHLSQVLKTPIVFDQLYGFKYNNFDNRNLQSKINPQSGITLHSWQTTVDGINFNNDTFNTILGAVHKQGSKVRFTAAIPQEFQRLSELLNFDQSLFTQDF